MYRSTVGAPPPAAKATGRGAWGNSGKLGGRDYIAWIMGISCVVVVVILAMVLLQALASNFDDRSPAPLKPEKEISFRQEIGVDTTIYSA
jgi:hypothetical protein